MTLGRWKVILLHRGCVMPEADGPFVTSEMCAETSARVLEKLDSIEKRLFQDNGTVSIQTRLDRHEQVIRALLWVVGILGGSFLAACGSGIVIVVRELIIRGAS